MLLSVDGNTFMQLCRSIYSQAPYAQVFQIHLFSLFEYSALPKTSVVTMDNF